jgi:hypothetical protein
VSQVADDGAGEPIAPMLFKNTASQYAKDRGSAPLSVSDEDN